MRTRAARKATMGEVLVVGTSPSVSRRRDGRRGVAPNVAAVAGLGVRLGVDVGAEVGGQGGRPVGGAGGIEVDGEVERLEVADVLQANSQFSVSLLVCSPAHRDRASAATPV